MTVTFSVPTGEFLPSRTAPRVFTCTRELEFACVRYRPDADKPVPRAVEMVWFNGEFQYPYSLASNVKGNTYTVVRQGGWSEDLELHVREVTPLPATLWSTLYQKDLRTLPNQVILPKLYGQYLDSGYIPVTLDGVAWALQANNGIASVVNGAGIAVTSNGTASGGNGYAGCHMSIRADLLPGFDPAKKTCVQIRATGLATQLKHVGASMYTGASQYAPANDHIGVRFGVGGSGVRANIFGIVGTNGFFTANYYGVDPLVSTPDVGNRVFAVAWSPKFIDTQGNQSQARYSLFGSWGGAMPAPEDMEPVSANKFSFDINDPALAGMYVGADSGGGEPIFHLTHIRVLQK